MTILLIILGTLLSIAGFIGCILPVLPGPPLSYLALIAIAFAKGWEPFSITFLIVMGILAILITLLDYVLPLVGASRYGASKTGIILSIVGMFIGIFILPPWGIFIGAFVGAVAGEMLIGAKGKDALRAGWGIFVGNMLSTGIKLGYSIAVIFFYIKAMI
jgi:uncharacterized protein